MFRIGTGECKYRTEEDARRGWAALNYFAESWNDYPEEAVENAKRALKYKEKHGSSCGTLIGWKRANMLSTRTNLTRETIARMASFKRHEANKNVPYSVGCGGLMWDAWGGDAGINWAIRKLEQIKNK